MNSQIFCCFIAFDIFTQLSNLNILLYADFFLYRIVFPVMGIWLITLDISLSKSLVFYYGVAMAVGVFLVKPMLFFEVTLHPSFSKKYSYLRKLVPFLSAKKSLC